MVEMSTESALSSVPITPALVGDGRLGSVIDGRLVGIVRVGRVGRVGRVKAGRVGKADGRVRVGIAIVGTTVGRVKAVGRTVDTAIFGRAKVGKVIVGKTSVGRAAVGKIRSRESGVFAPASAFISPAASAAVASPAASEDAEVSASLSLSIPPDMSAEAEDAAEAPLSIESTDPTAAGVSTAFRTRLFGIAATLTARPKATIPENFILECRVPGCVDGVGSIVGGLKTMEREGLTRRF